jgi:bifunctional DNA-binding transcriptional regulator/antitoxin component of YhaV-PrlF toxin-antitoxin module
VAERKRKTRTIKAIRSGQITIPADFRRELDITDDSLLQMSLEGDGLRITKLRAVPDLNGSPWLAELYERFAPVRQEAIDRDYSEEEINEAIDQAIAGVRASKKHV